VITLIARADLQQAVVMLAGSLVILQRDLLMGCWERENASAEPPR